MFKVIFWLVIIASVVVVGGKAFPVYYNNVKVQNVFEGIAVGLPNGEDDEINTRMQALFRFQGVNGEKLPASFYENLTLRRNDGKLEISTNYHVIVWIFGKPTSINPNEDYLESDVKGLDKLRLKAKIDFDFAPRAITP